MGFYLRKSLTAGAFRFNLSKSGVGVSVGFKGFRVGAGPRGNYVHMGRGGIYYRASLGNALSSENLLQRPATGHTNNNPFENTKQSESTIGAMQEIESGDVLQMTDSSSANLLKEIKDKKRLIRFLPFVIAVSLMTIAFAAWIAWWLCLIVIVPICCVCVYVWFVDDTRKSIVLFYEFDPEAESKFALIHTGYEQLFKSHRIWHVESRADVHDSKYHAGADSVIKRTSISLGLQAPPDIKTNVAIPSLPAGRQRLYFFPDRVLVFDPSGVGSIPYSDLRIDTSTTRFIEEGGVPRDSRVVDQTWRFTNKSGGPDRRFSNNYQIPIAEYGTIHLQSTTGLNELFQVSQSDAGHHLESAVRSQ